MSHPSRHIDAPLLRRLVRFVTLCAVSVACLFGGSALAAEGSKKSPQRPRGKPSTADESETDGPPAAEAAHGGDVARAVRKGLRPTLERLKSIGATLASLRVRTPTSTVSVRAAAPAPKIVWEATQASPVIKANFALVRRADLPQHRWDFGATGANLWEPATTLPANVEDAAAAARVVVKAYAEFCRKGYTHVGWNKGPMLNVDLGRLLLGSG